MEFWERAEAISRDGHLRGFDSTDAIDGLIGVTGFASAMLQVGWLRQTAQGMSIPEWDRWNGDRGRAKAATRERVRRFRDKGGGVAPCNASCTDSVTRNDETGGTIGGESSQDFSLDGSGNTSRQKTNRSSNLSEAEKLYEAYPRKVGRATALKAIQRALAKCDFATLMEAVQAFAVSPKGRDEQFCPYPATWFNGGRWTDDRSSWQVVGGKSQQAAPKLTTEEKIRRRFTEDRHA